MRRTLYCTLYLIRCNPGAKRLTTHVGGLFDCRWKHPAITNGVGDLLPSILRGAIANLHAACYLRHLNSPEPTAIVCLPIIKLAFINPQ